MKYEKVKRQLNVTWNKFASGTISRDEMNRRNQLVMNLWTKHSLGVK